MVGEEVLGNAVIDVMQEIESGSIATMLIITG
jgi:hypothetical protein